jgi:hypothetical protein
MKRNIIRLSCLVLFTTFLYVAGWAQAFTKTTTDSVPVSLTLYLSDCNGEIVNLEGTQNVLFHLTVSNSGRVSLKMGLNGRLEGVGETSGKDYLYTFSENQSLKYDSLDFAPFVISVTSHSNSISRGGMPNSRVRFDYQMVINANGDLVSSRLESTVECK